MTNPIFLKQQARLEKAGLVNCLLLCVSAHHRCFDDLLFLDWLVGSISGDALNSLNDFVAGSDFAKNRVPHIEPGCPRCGYEELAAVGARSGVGHRQDASFVETQIGGAFVLEGLPPNRLAPTTGPSGIAALNHEIWNDAVENDSIVVAILHVSSEILACFWGVIRIKLYFDRSLIGFQFDLGAAHRGLVLWSAFGLGKDKSGRQLFVGW